MTEAVTTHRLEGLEPDNLLAFLALLGLLRALEAVGAQDRIRVWLPRVSWSVEQPPLRPVLHLASPQTQKAICEAAATGVAMLAADHDFAGQADLNYRKAEARALLDASIDKRSRADLLTSLMSDAAVKEDKDQVEATPFCLLFGQGHQHFLDRFTAVPNTPEPPPRGRGKKAIARTAAECLAETLFHTWERPDATFAFRWDPAEDVRYAMIADDPSTQKTCTQHGANRLAAVGLAALPVVPVVRQRRVRLATIGGSADRRGFSFAWPIWRHPASLSAIRALLAHPHLREPEKLARNDVVQVVEAGRMSVGKFMNFTHGRPLSNSGSL